MFVFFFSTSPSSFILVCVRCTLFSHWRQVLKNAAKNIKKTRTTYIYGFRDNWPIPRKTSSWWIRVSAKIILSKTRFVINRFHDAYSLRQKNTNSALSIAKNHRRSLIQTLIGMVLWDEIFSKIFSLLLYVLIHTPIYTEVEIFLRIDYTS